MADVIIPRYYLWSMHADWEYNVLELRNSSHSRFIFGSSNGAWIGMSASDIEFREDIYEMIFESPTIMGILECKDMCESLRLSIIKWLV